MIITRFVTVIEPSKMNNQPKLDPFTIIDAFVRSLVWCIIMIYICSAMIIIVGVLQEEMVAMRTAYIAKPQLAM